WSFGELGATEPLVAAKQPLLAPLWFELTLACVAFFLCAVAAVLCTRRLRAEESFLVWSLAGQVALIAVLWLFYDRYLLPLVPLAIALLLAGRPALRRSLCVAFLLVFATLSIVGLRDHLAYNSALWRAVDALSARGVPESQIDAGYVVDGWFHFAHSENGPRH